MYSEDGDLQLRKRRDSGITRGHRQGSLPHFQQERADQRAGAKLEKPTQFDDFVQAAMQNGPVVTPTAEQKKLEQKQSNRVRTVSQRHEEMIKPESAKLTEKWKPRLWNFPLKEVRVILALNSKIN